MVEGVQQGRVLVGTFISHPCLCLQFARATFSIFQKKKKKARQNKTSAEKKNLGGGRRDTTTKSTRTPHTARTPVNRRHVGQDTAHAHAPRAAKG